MHAFSVAAAFALLAIALPAQRGKPTLDWQKRTTTIDFGIVPLGQHGLDELKVGQEWRLGQGDATSWSLQMPALVGDKVVPPGRYRLRLQRLGDRQCAVLVQGSHFLLGGEDLRIDGELGKAAKPAKKLAIDFEKGASKDKATLPVQLKVTFGESEWKGTLAVVGSKSSKVGAYQLTVFALPLAVVTGRDKVPIAVAALSKGPESWNVLVSATDAKLVPWSEVPSDNFAELKGPKAERIQVGTVEAADTQSGDGAEFLELLGASLQKGSFDLQFASGKQTLNVSLPEPKSN